MAEHKILGIILAVGLIIVAGIFAFIDDGEDTNGSTGVTVAVAPPDAETLDTGSAIDTGENATPLEPDSPLAGKILVSNRPVEVRAAPSPTASAMYGFPAGRPFRALGREGDFIRIQDVRSGTTGWIEEAALAPAPTAPPPVAATPRRSQSQGATPQRQRTFEPPAETAAQQPRKRRGIFGGDGLFGGLFGGR